MIYTLTFNPAIDYVVHPASFELGATNRSTAEEYYFGGKGINVSTILKRLDIDNVALGFTCGFTGKALEEGLASEGVTTDFIHLSKGFTRINVKIKGQEETELNGKGPDISDDELAQLFSKVEAMTEDDIIIISGNTPAGLPEDIYEQILKITSAKGVLSVVDATGELLLKSLKYKPFLIKPNNHELSDIAGRKLSSEEEIAEGARQLKEMGARNVLISRGADGALLVTESDDVLASPTIRVDALNTVGAGDSMVAGFLAGYLKTQDYSYALKAGIAAGSATASSPGLAAADDIRSKLETLL